MKLLFKIKIILIILIGLPISVYYGLRFFDEPMYYEFNNRSYVVTLPSRVWFEIDTSLDQFVEKEDVGNLFIPFEDSRPNVKGEGINIGLSYPKIGSKIEENGVSKHQTLSRLGDTLVFDSEIKLKPEILQKYDTYVINILFSQYGRYDYQTNTYSQEGCDVKFESEEGEISYREDQAKVFVSYELYQENLTGTIRINVNCFNND
ncbi:hypothetical protein HYV12_00705 [Candidatus Dojkabacteria bacterium]|nr:hypothetical protein [Candidatus Dojkabacteria bacterium]